MAAIAEQIEISPDALPVCLNPWIENPYRLVSLWDMIDFDAGRLCNNMAFLSAGLCFNSGVAPDNVLKGQISSWSSRVRKDYTENLERLGDYCDTMSFPLTRIIVRRILDRFEGCEDTSFTVKDLGDLLGNALERLKDEAGTYLFLHVASERERFYRTPRSGWDAIISRFPDTVTDIEEASICFALDRHAACVFHCVQVVEHGLIALGRFMNIKDPKSGWTATSNELERITKKKFTDLTPFEVQHIVFFKQVYATVTALQDAWRNKISHAEGRLAVMTAEFAPRIAEEIMMATRGFMGRLASDLPVVP
jgi:hypothetical protein